MVNREFFAKKLSVETYQWKIYGEGQLAGADLEKTEYRGGVFAVWLRDKSVDLLRQHEFANRIAHGILFKEPVPFERDGEAIKIRAIELLMECKRTIVVQTVTEDVSRGLYDHLKKAVVIPNEQAWSVQFDASAWREVEVTEGYTAEIATPPGGTIQLGMILLNPIYKSAAGEPAPLDELVETEETVVNPEPRTSSA